MRSATLVLAGAAAAALSGSAAFAQPQLKVAEKPTVDVYVRGQAGLPASSARGEIEVVDVGQRALDLVLSIVGHRTAKGWRVSYVCAQSPGCDTKHFLLAKEFDLSADAARRVDVVLDRLKTRPEAATESSATDKACGHLAVAINDRGVKRDYRPACPGDKDLGELETLLKAGLP